MSARCRADVSSSQNTRVAWRVGSGRVDLSKKQVGSFTGAWGVFWLRYFWRRFVLTRRILGCLSKDKRSNLEAAAEIRTGGFAGDRLGAWRRVERFLAMRFCRFWKSSFDDQSGRQNRRNGGLWKQLQEKRGTAVFLGKKLFSENPRLVLRITMPKD